MRTFLIAPSILSADFAKLGQEVEQVVEAGADLIHFDVMDNHYVPNLTCGPMICQALRNYGIQVPIDVHLMASPVERLIEDFGQAGASMITFHPEATDHVDRCLSLIKEQGCKAGLVLNPATPLHHLDHVMDKLDVILLMSVNPGFGGQKFISSTLSKIRQVRERIDGSDHSILLQVDGGVTAENIADIAQAGADIFVAGSAIFKQSNYQQAITQLRDALARVSPNS
tara:strand:- start:5282 stop:5962 length:681 start_codon:yes stop_codon:yes gene_type:complete